MKTDNQLLEGYARDGSEQDFRELVERRINLVYSAALREAAGDASAAEDITQAVFTELARRAASLIRHPALAGWLYTCVRRMAANARRAETRRHRRELEAFTMNELLSSDPNDQLWQQLRPVLDDVMHELDEEDRPAVVLRFFEGRSLKDVGLALGLNENAARMRVDRSLEKLRTFLSRRGVKSTAATLTAALALASVSNASAAFAKTVATSALASATTTSAAGWLGSAKVKLAAACGAAVLTAGLIAWHRESVSQKAVAGEHSAAAIQAAVATAPTNGVSPAPTPNGNDNGTSTVPQMVLQVVDEETGAPLAGAKVHLAYFRINNSAKVVRKPTDAGGNLAVDKVESPFTCMNMFVAAEGHAPKTVSWNFGGLMLPDFTLKLPKATQLAGIVTDEAGNPITGAKIEFDIPSGSDLSQQENIEFGPDTTVHTDTNGHWFSSMIPADLDRVHLNITCTNYADTEADLRPGEQATNSIIVMAAGFNVEGAVTDLNGLAIKSATIHQVRQNAEGEAKATTDALGNFAFKNIKGGELILAAQAEGFAPVVKTIQVSKNITPMLFQLGPGNLLRGHIVDDHGNPVANARIKTDLDRMAFRKIDWSKTLGATGAFEWNSAPQEPLIYAVYADGFTPARWVTMAADGTDHEIKLTPSGTGNTLVHVTATVVDADDGQPVDSFSVRRRRVEPTWVVPLEFATRGQNGKFSLPVPTESVHAMYQLEVEKDGYLPALSSNLLTKDGDQILTFKLQRGSGPAGVVLLPTGEPATNATVYFCTQQSGVRMEKPGRADKGLNTTPYLTHSDDAGRFSLPGAPTPQGVIVLDDKGIADTSLSALAASSNITLQAWGRIDGTLVLDSQPVTNERIFASHQILRYDEEGRHFGYLTYDYETTTDAAGHFAFDKVPPGPCRVCRGNNDHSAEVTINSGSTIQVTLGGSGTSVAGLATVAGTSNSIDWISVWVELKSPHLPAEKPKRENFATTNAYIQACQAFRAAHDASAYYSEHCESNGVFRLPDVPPGEYELKIQMRANQKDSTSASPEGGVSPVVASLTRGVTVGADPLDLGTLPLAPIVGAQASSK